LPQVIAVAATWVATAATAVAAAAVPTLTIGQSLAIATVANAAAHVAISTALSVAAAALTKPKVSAASGVQTDVQLNPQSPVPYVIGRTKVGGQVVYQTTTGAKNKYQLFYRVLSGGGPIEAFEAFEGNGAAISFGTDGGEGASGTYQNRLWMKRALNAGAAAYGGLRFTATGTKDTPADHGGNPPEWTTAHQASDYAMSLVAYEYDSAKFSGGPLKPGDILKGARVYDPRLDSTYPGGSGDHRWADPGDAAAFSAARETWTWSENPYLHALTWVLGRWSRKGDEPYRRVLGIGASIDMVLVDQFVEGANVADANGWTLGGQVLSSDGKWEVLMGMLQAGGGEPMRLGAKIGCFVSTPRVSIATLARADFGDGDIAIPSSAVRRDRINRVIPRYRSEAHSWEIVPASPVLVDEYVTADGGERTREMDLPYVQDKDQAAQLAALAIVNAREFGPGNLPLKPKWMGLKPGDCVTINEPELNLSGQLVTIRSRSLDMATAARQITFMSETAEKYDYVLGRTGFAPPVPSLTAADLTPDAPDTDDWVATGATLTDNGVSIPAIVIVGEMADPHVVALLVRYRPAGATDWTSAPAVELVFDEEVRLELTGLTPETTYELEIAFRSVRGVASAWTALADVVAGSYAFATLGTADGLLTVYYQTSAPTAPERGDVWFDTDAGNAPYQWDGTAWIDASDNAAVQAIQFATAAQATANSKILTFYQTAEPTASGVGDLWVDTDDGNRRVYRWNGSSWLVIADQTGFNTAAAITGQGALATLNQAAWATQITGTGKPEDYATKSLVTRSIGSPSSPGVNDIWVALDGGGTPVAVYAWTGSAWVKGADTTLFFTAAAITGQGALATLNQAAWATQITGTGKPEDYATKSVVTRSIGSPSSPGVNDIWVALDGGGTPVAVYAWTGSAWVKGADTTLFFTAAAITGQGALATLNDADWATRVTGVGKPDDYANRVLHYKQNATPSSPGVNDIWTKLDGVGNPIAVYAFNGSVWINGADRTIYNTAAAITGQAAWATETSLTPTVVGNRTQYFGTDGRLYDYRGVLYGYSVDGVAGRATQPLSAGAGTVSVASHNVYFPTASGTTSISVPSTTHTGLLYDTDYTIYYRPQYGDHHAVQSIYAWAFNASIDGYMWIGNVRTASSGGSWTAPPTDTADFVGVYSDIMCVWSDAFLASGQRAGDAVAGDPLTLMAPGGDSIMPGRVLTNVQGVAQCLTFETACGAVKTLSLDTPIMTRAAPGCIPTATWAKACLPGLMLPVLTEGDELIWDELVSITNAGLLPVSKIAAEGVGIYAASDAHSGPRLFTHNMYNKA